MRLYLKKRNDVTSCPCGYLQGHSYAQASQQKKSGCEDLKKRRRGSLVLAAIFAAALAAGTQTVCAAALKEASLPPEEEVFKEYQDYRKRLGEIGTRPEIEEMGFEVVEDQIFPLETACFGRVELIPAIEETYHRLVFFFVKEDGTVAGLMDQLAANDRNRGEMRQSVRGLSAVSFQDLDADGRTDLVFIVRCSDGEGGEYRVGDVLFQGETGFYRDYRISDKINRFGMNKCAESIVAFVRDGKSTEFLYTAITKEELLENGFVAAKKQCYFRQFEKLGRLEVVPGSYTMADYATFLIYLVTEEGEIVWRFEPMGDYDSLYALKGIACRDIDGDGMKDLLVLARYSTVGDDNIPVVESSYSIYYQRTGGFYEDTEVKPAVPCEDGDTVAELVEKARAYWGWRSAL